MSVTVHCFGCGALSAPVSERLQVGGYVTKRCGNCACWTTDPLPTDDELATFYSSYSNAYTGGMGSRYEGEMPKRLRARLRLLAAHGGRGKLLDLGGGNGMFARLAYAAGFSVSVSDYVPSPVDLGVATVIPGDLSRRNGVPFPAAAFDVVTLWSCIEHVRDPDAALSEVHRLVRPGGLVAIDTPLIGDLCERHYAARSHWVAPPEHLNVFSARGLNAAVTRAGLNVVLHQPFHERTRVRWLARRARNLAVAAKGVGLKLRDPQRWASARGASVTSAGDIQLLLARRPS